MSKIPVRLLVVEDNEVDRMAFERLVRKEHLPYECRYASSVSEARDMLAAERPDIALLDYMLGDGTSFELFDALQNIPFLLTTGTGDEAIAVEAMKRGAYDYLIKDPNGNYLLTLPFVLKHTLDRWRAERDLVQHQNRLEELVEERTAELMATSERLRAEIAEREQIEQERIRLLAQTRAYAQQVQQIINTVPEGVLLLDANGKVITANPVARKDLAALAGAQVGDTLTRLGNLSLSDLLKPAPRGFWHEIVLDSPTPRFFEALARPVEAKETVGGNVLLLRDVTREREIEQHIQQQDRLAAIGQLAGGIAHDFNNLLTTIMLYAHLPIKEAHLSPNTRHALEIISQESSRAAKLVQQILDFSRRSPMDTQPLDLIPFIKEASRILERTIPESIALRFVRTAKSCMVNADPTRIQQVLMNLAVNARDAMPRGGELRIELMHVTVNPDEPPPVPEMRPGDWVCLAVSDTGTGIPSEVLPRIFEPFYTTKPKGEGTGLGLAQVHGIVAQHGGHVRVETEIGKGSTFHVYLPAYTSKDGDTLSTEQVVEPPKGNGEIILFVEDQERLRAAGQMLLESQNYRVVTAASGQEALTVYASTAGIALVITDVVMPGLGGAQLMQALWKKDPHLKALAMTGYVEEHQPADLKKLGFLEILYKPFTLDALADAVHRALAVD